MTRSLISASLVALVLASFSAMLAQTKPAKVRDLGWIAGCWEINKPEKKTLVSEQWMLPAGDAMIGMSRTVRDGKLGGFEFLRIVQTSDGIDYISKPEENKEETAFRLTNFSSRRAIFENPTHDFPQRIIYKLITTNRLNARIEGVINGNARGIDFPFVRTKCG